MNYQSILEKAGYPTTTLILDFESYYDKDYSLKKISTIEYVCDSRFELLGLGYQNLEPFCEAEFLEPKDIEWYIQLLKDQHGSDLEDCTIIGQNLFFDCLILKRHFGITPRYTVDIRDLDRVWDARDKHSLASHTLSKSRMSTVYWGVIPKCRFRIRQSKKRFWPIIVQSSKSEPCWSFNN